MELMWDTPKTVNAAFEALKPMNYFLLKNNFAVLVMIKCYVVVDNRPIPVPKYQYLGEKLVTRFKLTL